MRVFHLLSLWRGFVVIHTAWSAYMCRIRFYKGCHTIQIISFNYMHTYHFPILIRYHRTKKYTTYLFLFGRFQSILFTFYFIIFVINSMVLYLMLWVYNMQWNVAIAAATTTKILLLFIRNY